MDNYCYSICNIHKVRAILNRSYAIFHTLAAASILYYRATTKNNSLLAWVSISVAELLLLFMWIVQQPYYWRPVSRTVFPEKLPKDEDLPGVDVFICTVDPTKEPTFEVMNTVISAMSLDYPAHKLSVYLSDDGAASVTLDAIKHAWVFASWWLPFCKKYHVKSVCPKAFFHQQITNHQTTEFIQDANILKEKYEIFEQRVRSWKHVQASVRDHSQIIQVINETSIGEYGTTKNPKNVTMPLLVYLAREKRPSHPHHFKAGALNVLQRVSSILSNATCVLVLDCDMYCNDSISARQAMCYYLDPKLSPSLAFVQYPQKFHNISKTDVYNSQMRTLWPVVYPGCDGLQGPLLSGTNFYINRKALYGFDFDGGLDTNDLRQVFGSSNELIKSLSQINQPNATKPRELSSAYLLGEAEFVASCAYEEDTQWGRKVGFLYDTVVEDVTTGYILHSQGWKSVFLNPKRPQFLGSATTNLNEALVQNSRWTAGLVQLGLSKYCPLFYNSSTPRMQILQRMLYIWATFYSFDFLSISCFAIIPPICFFYGIPLYPKASDPFFIPFAFVFISAQMKHLCETIFLCGGSVNSWLNEERFAMIKSVTCYAYGILECVMTKLGIREANFMPTNKAEDDDYSKWYQNGKYDFRTSNIFLVPIVAAVTLNLTSFVVGATRVIVARSWDALFAQVFFSIYVLIISLPMIEGMLIRKDNARVPLTVTLISTLLSWIVLSLGYFIVLF